MIMIFSYARGPFLEFLRNLTPQVLLFSIALVFGSKLDINKPDLSNTWNSLPFVIVILTFFAAVLANVLAFIDGACRSIKEIDEESKKLQEQGLKGFKLAKENLNILRKKSKALFLEIVIVGLIVQVGFIGVVFMSIQTGTALYNTLHGIVR